MGQVGSGKIFLTVDLIRLDGAAFRELNPKCIPRMVWTVCKCLKQAFIRLSLKNFKVINVVRQLRLIRGIGQIKQKIGLLFFFLGEGAFPLTVCLSETLFLGKADEVSQIGFANGVAPDNGMDRGNIFTK